MEEFLDHIPLSEEEALGLFAAGDYPATFEKVEIKTSKAGNRCFVATIKLSDPAKSSTHIVTTWFGLPYLIKHAYESAGLSDKYNSSKLSTSDLVGKKVMAKVKISKITEQYPVPKNEIWDFVVSPDQHKFHLDIEPPFNESIPF